MRLAWLALIAAALPATALAQAIVTSPRPDKVAVTVYRQAYAGEMQLDWLGGFAMISETRRVSIPAGSSELRFEGVAGGLVPQSAVVTGLGPAVIEKNRDAKLLSPGTLLDAHLGRRVHLRRTSRATGEVREQEAVIRASGEGVVIETEGRFEALRCTGLPETILTDDVPATLPARPTLSVRLHSERAVETDVQLTYLSSDFDWRAHYVATLAPNGRELSLFAWLTLANGDETGFANADTMAVAGRLNREETERLQPEMRPIQLTCWPAQRTHEIPANTVDSETFDLSGTVTVEGLMAPAPPPPAAEAITVTGSKIIAQREDLGDLKLYRIPIPVTVASRSQKQVALLEQPKVKVETLYRWRAGLGADTGGFGQVDRMLRLHNRESDGLGLPLPAGSLTLYTERNGQLLLIGEGGMDDRAVGEKVDVVLDPAPGVRVSQRQLERGNGVAETELVVTNDQPHPVRFELQFADERKVLKSSVKLTRRDGSWWWWADLPANGRRTLTVRYAEPD